MDEGKEEAHDIMTWFCRSPQGPASWHRLYERGSGRIFFNATQTCNREVQESLGLAN